MAIGTEEVLRVCHCANQPKTRRSIESREVTSQPWRQDQNRRCLVTEHGNAIGLWHTAADPSAYGHFAPVRLEYFSPAAYSSPLGFDDYSIGCQKAVNTFGTNNN